MVLPVEYEISCDIRVLYLDYVNMGEFKTSVLQSLLKDCVHYQLLSPYQVDKPHSATIQSPF